MTNLFLIKTGLEKIINAAFIDSYVTITHSDSIREYQENSIDNTTYNIFCINPSHANSGEIIEQLHSISNKEKKQSIILNLADQLGKAKIIVNLSWGGMLSIEDKQTEFINQIQSLIAGQQSVSSTIKAQFFEDNFSYTNQEKSNINKLSKRQLEIVKLVADGNSAKHIADQLSISINTVQNHKSQILQTTEAKNSAHLISMCCKAGLLSEK